jgi:hypothetical protein
MKQYLTDTEQGEGCKQDKYSDYYYHLILELEQLRYILIMSSNVITYFGPRECFLFAFRNSTDHESAFEF